MLVMIRDLSLDRRRWYLLLRRSRYMLLGLLLLLGDIFLFILVFIRNQIRFVIFLFDLWFLDVLSLRLLFLFDCFLNYLWLDLRDLFFWWFLHLLLLFIGRRRIRWLLLDFDVSLLISLCGCLFSLLFKIRIWLFFHRVFWRRRWQYFSLDVQRWHLHPSLRVILLLALLILQMLVSFSEEACIALSS